MPIPVRHKPFLEPGCPGAIYAGLARLSPGCPPDRGRLHTCYSPVRRSPAEERCRSSPLPLDLHVLSLPLAFILSQDQTLRCYMYLFRSFLLLLFVRKAVCSFFRIDGKRYSSLLPCLLLRHVRSSLRNNVHACPVAPFHRSL